MRYFLWLLGLFVLERGLAMVIRWFEVMPVVVVLHFIVVMVMVTVAVMGLGRGTGKRDSGIGSGIGIGIGLVGLSILTGSWLSAHIGGAEACQGFPLCNGAIFPNGGYLVLIHWLHRIVAYLTVLFLLYYCWKRSLSTVVIVTFAAVSGVAIVLGQLPRWMTWVHLALGVVLWSATILWWRRGRSYYSS